MFDGICNNENFSILHVVFRQYPRTDSMSGLLYHRHLGIAVFENIYSYSTTFTEVFIA